MTFRTTLAATAAAIALALPAFAEPTITIEDPYARSSGKSAKSGAAFMVIHNTGDEDDRLIAATSDISKRVELHTHKEDAEGVMRMIEVEEGFAVAAGDSHALQRGGDHVMFMGLTTPMEQDATFSVTLTFEKAGDIEVTIPVDLERKPRHGGGMGHGMKMQNKSGS